MCGIAGIISTRERVDRCLLADMRDVLAHRGPDDAGLWTSADGRVGLANRRLAILDLSPAGHMPMCDGDLCITYNGEIYNYVELRDELSRHGHRFRTSSDTEVLLKAYRQWGLSFLTRLNGMFAFALWDSSRNRLVMARDRFGEKPFYYTEASALGSFAFASEIKALLKYPHLSRNVNDAAIFRYLVLGQVDGDEQTFFANVQQLRPAHALVWEDGKIRTERYWDIDADKLIHYNEPRDYGEHFRDLFLDAVRLRLRSDVAVGTSLSGGLDSSSVVCAVQSVWNGSGPNPQCTFSARYAEGETDEGQFIQAVVEHTRVRDYHTWITAADLCGELERFIYHQDEPVAHTSPFAQWKVYDLARKHGVTVLLDGQGADEFLAGYHPPSFGGRFMGLLRQGAFLGLFSELNAYRKNHGSLLTGLRYLSGVLLSPELAVKARMRYYDTADIVNPSWIRRHLPACIESGRVRQFRTPLKSILFDTLTRTSLPGLLRYGDRNSTAHSREARLPFLDHRLVEYVYAVPDEQIISGGVTKLILRRAMHDLLPPLVRDRQDKIGFSTPEGLWFRGQLRPWLEQKVDEAKGRGIVQTASADRHWAGLLAGKGRSANVWRIANLEAWMQMFVDH
jgi:asparagine synthase (glutamine-hydrolysing)